MFSYEAITREYIRKCAKNGEMHQTLLCAVLFHDGQKKFIPPAVGGLNVEVSEEMARRAQEVRQTYMSGKTPVRAMVTGGVCSAYGMEEWGDLFTDRQILALDTFSGLIHELITQVQQDAASLGATAKDYAHAVAVLMACAIGRAADFWSSNATWESSGGFISHVFTRQGLPMVWDFAEGNPFFDGTGWNWGQKPEVDWVCRVVDALSPNASGTISMGDAAAQEYQQRYVFSTDPPYFDNISYAVLSDYFYIWQRKCFEKSHPDLCTGFSRHQKTDELIATAVSARWEKSAGRGIFCFRNALGYGEDVARVC